MDLLRVTYETHGRIETQILKDCFQIPFPFCVVFVGVLFLVIDIDPLMDMHF